MLSDEYIQLSVQIGLSNNNRLEDLRGLVLDVVARMLSSEFDGYLLWFVGLKKDNYAFFMMQKMTELTFPFRFCGNWKLREDATASSQLSD